jgi:pilus assembly protein CpaE
MIFRATIDAFTLAPATAAALDGLKADSAFAMARIEVRPGGIAAAISAYAGRSSPQLVIVEEEDDDATLLAHLDRLAEVCDAGTRVVVIGRLNDIGLFRTLMARGVSEYLVAPVNVAQLAGAIAKLFTDPDATSRGKVIAFWGARGGVGASTLAQNTAHALGARLPEPAIYIDLDLAFGASLLAFNIDPRQTVGDALGEPERLDPVLLDRLMLTYDDKVRVLAAAADPRQARIPTLDGIDRLLDLAATMAPAVVVDLPRAWSDWTEHVLAAADETVVVATPDLAALRETKTLLDTLAPRRAAGNPARVVVNKVDAYRKTQLSPKDFTETLGVAPMLILAFEPQLFGDAANTGQMLGVAAKGHKVVEAIGGFAERLVGRTVSRKRSGNPLLRLLQR